MEKEKCKNQNDNKKFNAEKMNNLEVAKRFHFEEGADSESSSRENPNCPKVLKSKSAVYDNMSCCKCGKPCRNITFYKNHLVSHYYPVFYKFLPDCQPFVCPECRKEHKDRTSLARHFALTHRKIFELTDITPDQFPFSEHNQKEKDLGINMNKKDKRIADHDEPRDIFNTAKSQDQTKFDRGRLNENKKTELNATDKFLEDISNDSSQLSDSIQDFSNSVDISSWDVVDEWNDSDGKGGEGNNSSVTISKRNNNMRNKICFYDVTTESKVTKERSNTCVGESVVSDSTLASKSKDMAPKNSKSSRIRLTEDLTTPCRNNDRLPRDSTSVSKSNEKLQNNSETMTRSSNRISIDSSAVSKSNEKFSVKAKILSKRTETACKYLIPNTAKNDNVCENSPKSFKCVPKHLMIPSKNEQSVHRDSMTETKNNDRVEHGLNRIEQKSNKSIITSHLSKPVSSEAHVKEENINSNDLPFGLYGLLFVDVEALLDGDTNSLQVTQLGCQTYFSNGELWSSFFSAVVPNNMAGYIKHSNQTLAQTLMSMLRITLSNSNYQLVRPERQSVHCASYEQARLKFSDYVMSIADLVDGIVFVMNRPSLILDFFKPIFLKSNRITLGLIDLTDVFTDSFPHSTNLEDISSIHRLVFAQESLPSDMDCESKSKLLVKIIEKVLPCIDYENFIQPYSKILPGNIQDPIIDVCTDELKLVGNFSPKIKTIIKSSNEYQIKKEMDMPKNKFRKEKAVSQYPINVKKNIKFSAKDKSVKIEDDNTDVVGTKLEEYFEPESNLNRFLKKDPIGKKTIVTSHEPAEYDNDNIISDALNASEPQGNIDIDTDDENDNVEYGSSISETRLSADLCDDVIVPSGPVCVCDIFTPSEPLSSVSGDLSGLCKECRSFQVTIICEVVSPSKVKTIVAKVEDSDGIVSSKSVKFLPSPFLIQQKKPVPYSQVRKVYLDNYIFLSTEGIPNKNLDLEKKSLIGLCQVWLGQKAEDLEYLDDIRLICEDIKILDDGTLVLLCSTELVLKRALPLMVSNISQYLHIKPEQRIVTASRTGMISLTCKSGTTGYLPSLGDNVGTATTDFDDDLIKQIVNNAKQTSEQIKRKSTNVIEVSKTKKSKVTKAPLKFGVKKAFKASPLIRAKVFTAAANESSEDSTSPSPPPLATVEVGSRQKQKRIPETYRASNLCNNSNLKTCEGKSPQPRINTASAAFLACTAGQQIPTIINRQTKNPSKPSQAHSQPVFHTPDNTTFYKQGGSQSTQHSPPKNSAIVLPKPTPASCSRCIFQSCQSMKLLPCNSCPYFQLVLTSDLALPPDKPTFAKVRFEEAILAVGPGVQIFAKVYTDSGVLKMPQSLNLLPSDNPTPIPKQFSQETVTVTFLNTVLQTVQLKAGQTVGRGQIIYIKK